MVQLTPHEHAPIRVHQGLRDLIVCLLVLLFFVFLDGFIACLCCSLVSMSLLSPSLSSQEREFHDNLEKWRAERIGASNGAAAPPEEQPPFLMFLSSYKKVSSGPSARNTFEFRLFKTARAPNEHMQAVDMEVTNMAQGAHRWGLFQKRFQCF